MLDWPNLETRMHNSTPHDYGASSQTEIVVLYGRSLFLAAVEMCLQQEERLTVMRLDPECPNTPKRLDTLHPHIIITESVDDQCLPPLTLTSDKDSTNKPVVIRFDRSNNNQTVVIKNRRFPMPDMAHLLEMILTVVRGSKHAYTTTL